MSAVPRSSRWLSGRGARKGTGVDSSGEIWAYYFLSFRFVFLISHVASMATMNSDKTPPWVFVVPNLCCKLGKAASKANLRPKQIGINSRSGTYFVGGFIGCFFSGHILPVRRSSGGDGIQAPIFVFVRAVVDRLDRGTGKVASVSTPP